MAQKRPKAINKQLFSKRKSTCKLWEVDGLGVVGRSAPGSYGPEPGSVVEASHLATFKELVLLQVIFLKRPFLGAF